MRSRGYGKRKMGGSESGFTLIEAVVATALLAIGIGGAMSAVLCVLRPIADNNRSALLTVVVQNVLTNLRAASAYDISTLAGAAGTSGKTTRFTVVEGDGVSSPVPIDVTVAYDAPASTPNGPVTVEVVAQDPEKHSLAVTETYVAEAPPLGATMSPDPSYNEYPVPGPSQLAPAPSPTPLRPCGYSRFSLPCPAPT
jgi:type II secretory pathway pseudopilin PulG